MSHRLLRWLIGLYPRAWRRRYGDELTDLVAEMADRGDQTRARLALTLIANAAVERIRGAGLRTAAVLGLVAVLVSATALALTTPTRHRPVVHVALTPRPAHKPVPRLVRITPAQPTPGFSLPCYLSSDSACSAIPCREFVSGGPAAELVASRLLTRDRRARGSRTSRGRRRGRPECVSNPSVHGQTFFVGSD